MTRYDLTDLRLFCDVVDAGSITGGAARSHLALAAASVRVRAMEDGIGVRLLERGARGVVPTPAGLTLLRHARTVLHQLDHLNGDLADHARGLRGAVQLWCNTAAITEFLPEPLAAFLLAHPRLDIVLEERPSIAIVPAVGDGRADIGIVAAQPDMAGLETLPFRADRLVVLVPAGHALAARRNTDFAALLPHDMIGHAEGSALQAHLDAHAARQGAGLRYRVRLRDFHAMARLVEQGVGIAIMPATAAARAARSMRVRRLALRDAWADRQLVLCMRRAAALPPPARLLVAALAGTIPPAESIGHGCRKDDPVR